MTVCGHSRGQRMAQIPLYLALWMTRSKSGDGECEGVSIAGCVSVSECAAVIVEHEHGFGGGCAICLTGITRS